MLEDAYRGVAGQRTRPGRPPSCVAADTHTIPPSTPAPTTTASPPGSSPPTGIPLGPGGERGHVGAGDRVVTRRNQRRPDRTRRRATSATDRLWTVVATHPDGSLTVSPADRHVLTDCAPTPACVVTLPAAYVAEHVDLGYATTAHRAQGVTVEDCHVLAGAGMTREALYVAMTRGRDANNQSTSPPTPSTRTCDDIPDPRRASAPARDILERILATSGAELSATQTTRQRQDQAASLNRLAPIRATLLADADRHRWEQLLPASGLDHQQTRQILNSPAAGALFAALRAGEADGHNMPRVLRSLAAGRPLEGTDDLAAVLHERVSRWLDDNPDSRSHIGEFDRTCPPEDHALTALLGAAHADPDDPIHHTLAEIDTHIRSRIQTITLEAANTRPHWAPPFGAEPQDDADNRRWRQNVALICAYRDLTGTTDHVNLAATPDLDDTARRRRRLVTQATATAHRLGNPMRIGS